MANLSKVVKVTMAQYETLVNGGTVSGQTYDANAIYLVDNAGTSGIYLHEITIYILNTSTYEGVLRFHVLNNSATAFTKSTFFSYVNTNYSSASGYYLPTIGWSYWGIGQNGLGSQNVNMVESVYAGSSSTNINMNCTNSDDIQQGGGITLYTTSSGTRAYVSAFTDKVISL